MNRIILPLFAVMLATTLVLFSTAHSEPAVSTPNPGTPRRTAILDALRPTIQKMTGQPRIVFMVEEMLVCGDWAYLCVHPQTPDASSRFETVTALIRRKKKGSKDWQLVRMPGIEAGEADDDEQAEKDQWSALKKEFPELPKPLIDAVAADSR